MGPGDEAREAFALGSGSWVPRPQGHAVMIHVLFWVAVKELKLSYYMGKPYYLLYIPIMVT